MSTDLAFDDDATAGRFSARRDGEVVGTIDYERRGDSLVFTHTGTVPAARGQGVAERLTRWALDGVRAEGASVVPACPYTAHFLDEHPDYADLRANG